MNTHEIEVKECTALDALKTQDMGEPHAENLVKGYGDGSYDFDRDPLSAVILKAFEGKDNEETLQDINYAINQLTKVKNLLS